MKKIFLWIVAVLLTPILLFVILTVLLYLPPVQQWAVDKAAAYASRETGMDISVGRIKLVFPLDLGVDDILVTQPSDSLPQRRDTIADISRVVVDVRLRPLFSGRVVVDELEISRAAVNTVGLVPSAHVRGTLGRLAMKSRGIDLGAGTVHIDEAELSDARVMVALSDTVPEDTTTSAALWKIFADRVTIDRTDLVLHTPGDTIRLHAYMGRAEALRTSVDLAAAAYGVGSLTWRDGALDYDMPMEPRAKDGLDANHIALSGVDIALDSIYYCAPETRLNIRRFAMRERSGIEISDLTGEVRMDSVRLHLPRLVVRTPDSELEARVVMDLNAMDKVRPGQVSLRLMASLGKQDIMRFCGGLPPQFIRSYPNRPLTVRASAGGNMRHVDLTGLTVELPTAFSLTADGSADNLSDTKRLRADIRLKGRTQDLSFLMSLADAATARNYRLPRGITLDGRLTAAGSRYGAKLKLGEGGGTVSMDGSFDAAAEAYRAKVDVDRINLHHFMPHDSLYLVTARAEVNGRGTDMLSRRSRLMAKASVDRLDYGTAWRLGDIKVNANIADGRAAVDVVSHNQLADGAVSLDALLDSKRIDATLSTDLSRADLYRLRLTQKPMQAGMCAHIDLTSDLKQSHSVRGYFNDFTIRTEKKTFRPKDLSVNVLTCPDTTWAKVSSGNLDLYMTAGCGYEKLAYHGNMLIEEIMSQTRNKVIDQPRLRELLPVMELRVNSGMDNPVANFLRFRGLTFNDFVIDMTTSPADGINGDMRIYSLTVDSMRLDTIRLHIRQEAENVRFSGIVQNNRKNPQFVFKTLMAGTILERGAEINLRYYDRNDKLGLLVGSRAEVCDSGIRVRFLPDRPTLGYKEFNLNHDNFVFLGRDRRIEAKVDLVADDGTGVKIYSDDQNRDMLQDLTVSLNQFDLDKITSVMPYAPRISGLLNGDFHLMLDKERQLTMVSDMSVRKMSYENCPMGDIGSEFAYLMRDDSTHAVEATLTQNGREVGLLSGTYLNRGKDGYLDATFDMMRFPLSTINGFLGDQLFGLKGYAEGSLGVKGAPSRPQVDGEVMLDSSYLVSVPYGVTLRFDNDPVRIVGSNLLFENFTMYAHNDNPLNIAGNIDFSNLDHITMDMRMRARDYQLINAKQTRGSIAYGKAFVNFMGYLKGDLDNLQMRGQLDVLGKTDMTYILEDSPLNSDDRLKDLVTFTDFRDTAHVEVKKPPIGGLDMLLMMNIEQGAHVFCALNADRSNYVSLEGGGELRMEYNPTNDMQLFGRYTINSGTMKYSLPIIPLKTFNIEQGSYIEFTGDMMNPRLNLSATESVKTLVGSEGEGNSRSVLFNCGVKVTKTLNDMGLEFTLEAPEDMTLTNELAAMSAEERGKIAVLMLSTGMYIADGNTGKFSMNSALNSFLQSEINNIAGNALRTVDISVGLDQNTDGTGNTYNDYSFKFAKRFWNNRFSFVIGGKLSDNSADAMEAEQDQTFIDNVSLEYRLDQTAMRYVRLFYNKEAYDMLEGRVTKYGAGFVWRKKADRFWQLFNFRSKDPAKNAMPQTLRPMAQPAGDRPRNTAIPVKQDTLTTDENKK